jgi:hypothetical protein
MRVMKPSIMSNIINSGKIINSRRTQEERG